MMTAQRTPAFDQKALRNALLGMVKTSARASTGMRTPVPSHRRLAQPLKGIQPTSVKWLWQDRIPMGKITIIDGDPGKGKSALTLDLAARVSRNGVMPDKSKGITGPVLVMNAEDDVSDSIVPRLLRAGADMSKVFTMKTIEDTKGPRLPEIPLDLDIIERAIKQTKAVLVIIDPFFSFAAGATSWSAMRRVMAPLAKLAQDTGTAVVIVRHLTKGAGQSAIYRGGGSMAIIGSARSAMLVGENPDNNKQVLLIQTKSNLAPFAPTLPFEKMTARGAMFLKWGSPIAMTADEYFERKDAALALARALQDAEKEVVEERKVR